ncbi:ABC transporter permease [Nonomuraea sp. NPDC005650]|uniref:ABC transporter permease n=1 Tax=Nonomuraea sp. NPDC005650 TaxID=3157045 RepID=UPI0033B1E63B
MLYVLRRFAVLVTTLLVASFLVFLIPYVTPGDPAARILRARVGDLVQDPQSLARLRAEYGLDRPLLQQYLSWLGSALQGDLGRSFTNGTEVLPQLMRALSVTASIAVIALLLALLVAVPLGAVCAVRRGTTLDGAITGVTQAFVAVPEYWLGPVLVLVFALKLGALPSSGWQGVESMVLPCLTLALRPMSYFTQVARSSMIEVLEAPYITAARGRGLSFAQTMLRHGLRNSVLPVLTLFAVWLAGLLGGSVVVEVIFSVPGVGRQMYDAVINNDVPLVQGGVVAVVALAVLITTLTDVLYTVINPTARASRVRA